MGGIGASGRVAVFRVRGDFEVVFDLEVDLVSLVVFVAFAEVADLDFSAGMTELADFTALVAFMTLAVLVAALRGIAHLSAHRLCYCCWLIE